MRSFIDLANRTWQVEVNVAQVRRVRRECDLDLPSLFDGKMEGLVALLEDACKLSEVVYCLLTEQVEKAGVSRDDFESALGGKALEAAGDALVWEVVDFFRDGSRRTVLSRALGRASGVQEAMTKKALQQMEQQSVEEAAEEAIRQAQGMQEQGDARTTASSDEKPSGSSGTSLESSGSTPPPSP